jgi:hypothetical protein
LKARSIELHGVNWEDVNIDKLIALGQNTNIILKGKIRLNSILPEEKNKLLTLKELYGEHIFDANSELYIYGPDAIYVFGPRNGTILEGDNHQFETIIFSENSGKLIYDIREGERTGVKIDEQSGLLTTVENGEEDVELTIVTLFVRGQDRFIDECNVTVKKRVYPQSIIITGSNKISEETTIYK